SITPAAVSGSSGAVRAQSSGTNLGSTGAALSSAVVQGSALSGSQGPSGATAADPATTQAPLRPAALSDPALTGAAMPDSSDPQAGSGNAPTGAGPAADPATDPGPGDGTGLVSGGAHAGNDSVASGDATASNGS